MRNQSGHPHGVNPDAVDVGSTRTLELGRGGVRATSDACFRASLGDHGGRSVCGARGSICLVGVVKFDNLDGIEEARRGSREAHQQHSTDGEVRGDQNTRCRLGVKPGLHSRKPGLVETGGADHCVNSVGHEKFQISHDDVGVREIDHYLSAGVDKRLDAITGVDLSDEFQIGSSFHCLADRSTDLALGSQNPDPDGCCTHVFHAPSDALFEVKPTQSPRCAHHQSGGSYVTTGTLDVVSNRPQVRETGNLRPLELATGAVMAGFTVALSVIATVIPMASALNLVAAVPMGIVAQRFRVRAVTTAGISATAVAFVAAGSGSAAAVALSALLGGIIGTVKRRGLGFVSALLSSLVIGPALALFSIVLLLVLAPLRTLLLTSLENTALGVAEILKRAPTLVGAAEWIENSIGSIIDYWWLWIGVSIISGIVLSTVVSYFVLGAVLDRLAALPSADPLQTAPDDRPIDPLPVTFDHVGFTYPGATTPALVDVNFTVRRGEFVTVVGHNGSGKSTLTRLLAGRAPTVGTLTRPGSAGLGRHGGTAVVLQRPESQILGTRVADDVVWGLPPESHPDVDALLAEVGLAGMGMRETSGLSGGEMQRLAVAAALARRPALLIADEATAMVDQAGREELVSLLAELPRRHPMAVVLVTHHHADTRNADRVIQLQRGRQIDHQPGWMTSTFGGPPSAPWPVSTRAVLQLTDVTHTYNDRTPWSRRALSDVNLTIGDGDGLLVLGGNGSGKSTLAWIMAGLIAPSKGTAVFDGKPVSRQLGTVGLTFQHSRLQLQRRTVAEDIEAAGGPEIGSVQVSWALDAVGLDRHIAGRSIDELSGGQMRRVVLAGLLVRQPRVLILDEPLAGLDPPGRHEILNVLRWIRRNGTAVVVISHDVDGMDAVCSRTIRLSEGRILDPAASSALEGSTT